MNARLQVVSPISTGLVLLFVSLASAGCGGESGERASDGAANPVAALAELEGREAFAPVESLLIDDEIPVGISFVVEATGTVSADLSGALLLQDGGRARLEATGTFAGEPMDVVMISDGDRMFWTGGPEGGVPTPSALREALAVGLMRMGVLHNLARLSGGAAPDRAEGGVREWVTVAEAAEADVMAERVEGDHPAWDMTVGGQPAGSFAMEFERGEPATRWQTVRFPQGIMQVVERYPAVTFGTPAPAGAFDTTPLDPTR